MFFKRYVKTVERPDPYRTGSKVTVDEPNWMLIARDGGIGLAALILLVVAWPFYTVPTGHRGVVTQFGKIIGIEGEGLAVLPPWQKLNVFNVRAEQADVENAEGATADQQPVKVSMTVRYSIAPDKVSEVFEKYSRDGNLDSYVATASLEAFKAVTAKYSAPDLISKRASVSADISSALRSKLDLYGAQVINIDMRNFSFSDSYMAAINVKVTQEQLRLGAENKLKTVEAEQKQKVAVAEAEASALRAKADGEAYQTTKVAEAQATATLANARAAAEALRVQNAALRESRDVLELRRIEVEMKKAENWKGEFPHTMLGSQPLPFMNIAPQK